MSKQNLGLNQESIQASNRALLLELIRKEGVCSRAHLAKKSRLQQSTVTFIVNSFIQWGLVRETGLISGSKGRRSIGLSINRESFAVLGVRLTRSGYSMGIFDLTGACVREKEYRHEENKPASELMRNIVAQAKALIAEASARQVLAVGIAVPGPFNIKDGIIVLMTEAEGWNALNLRETFRQELQLPTVLQHDASAGAWAQLWHNEQIVKAEALVYISVGQGVGSGIVINGETMEGSIGAAGEIGHMSIDYDGVSCECGNRGCLEKYTSSIALTKAINQKLSTDYSFAQIADLIRSGDEVCLRQYERCCDLLGVGIVNLINCLNPNEIVLGDDMVKVLPGLLLERVCSTVRQRVLPDVYKNQRITVDEMGLNAELYGAAVVAIKDIFKNSGRYFSEE